MFVSEGLVTFPESEARLTAIQQELVGQFTTVKLASESHPSGFESQPELWSAVVKGDLPRAQQALWLPETLKHSNDFLAQIQPNTHAGGRFVRYYVSQTDAPAVGEHCSPAPDSPYFRALLLFFSHINGPLGGEETFVVPSHISRDIGWNALANEMQVFYRNSRETGRPDEILGASEVIYEPNNPGGVILGRTFLPPDAPETIAADTIVRQLRKLPDINQHRVPYVLPDAQTYDRLGTTFPLVRGRFQVNARNFTDLLPVAVASERRKFSYTPSFN